MTLTLLGLGTLLWAVASSAVVVTPADASFPGRSGKIVYADPYRNELVTMHADGTHYRVILNIFSPTTPSYSADGQQIVFVSGGNCVEARCIVYVVNSDGTELREVTHDGSAFDPAFAPRGNRIVLSLRRPTFEHESIYTVKLNGSDLRRLTALDDRFSGEPKWSPKGDKIVFTRMFENERSPSIWTMRPDGSHKRRIVKGRYPDFAPDGSRLVYAAGFQVRTVALDGTHHHAIPGQTADDAVLYPTYSPNGRFIAASERCCDDIVVWNRRDGAIDRVLYPQVGSYTYPFYEFSWQPLPRSARNVLDDFVSLPEALKAAGLAE